LTNQDITKKAQLIMPLGGKPLRMVPHTPQSIRYFSFCQHLLEAGSLLLIGNIVHNDLHVMNILCDSPSSSKIIDFGLSWSPLALTPETAYTVFRTFNPSISQESPELTYIFGLEEYDETQTELILANIQDKKPTIQLLYKLLGIKPEVQIQELKKFAEQSISFKNKNWHSLFKIYWSKFDAWALGTILLTLFVDMSMSEDFQSSMEYKQKAKSALKTIKGLCECDPGKRLDAIQALALWAPESPLLKTPEVMSWLEHVKLVN
jgi:serine/threonine protein kinase